jgi:8-oxo-dGTP diphosphatase
MGTPLHVMAGVLLDPAGRVLLAQRPPGKHLAGLWEFPGGKLEPGESPQVALARELREELGIDPLAVAPLIRVPWQYGERGLVLDAWSITRWHGTPSSLEGQALQWCVPARVDPSILAPADRPILQALRLPVRYPITPAEVAVGQYDHLLGRLHAAIAGGERLLQLHLPGWPRETVRNLAAELLPVARQHDAWLMLHADIEGARQLGAGVGVQLEPRQLSEWSERPLPWRQPIGASCSGAAELAQAVRLGADFATLSAVAATSTQPEATPLGWAGFRVLVAEAALPVYALGGMTPLDAGRSRKLGGQGVAGTRIFRGG